MKNYINFQNFNVRKIIFNNETRINPEEFFVAENIINNFKGLTDIYSNLIIIHPCFEFSERNSINNYIHYKIFNQNESDIKFLVEFDNSEINFNYLEKYLNETKIFYKSVNRKILWSEDNVIIKLGNTYFFNNIKNNVFLELFEEKNESKTEFRNNIYSRNYHCEEIVLKIFCEYKQNRYFSKSDFEDIFKRIKKIKISFFGNNQKEYDVEFNDIEKFFPNIGIKYSGNGLINIIFEDIFSNKDHLILNLLKCFFIFKIFFKTSELYQCENLNLISKYNQEKAVIYCSLNTKSIVSINDLDKDFNQINNILFSLNYEINNIKILDIENTNFNSKNYENTNLAKFYTDSENNSNNKIWKLYFPFDYKYLPLFLFDFEYKQYNKIILRNFPLISLNFIQNTYRKNINQTFLILL